MKDTFRQALQARDRARSVMMCLDALQTGTTSVPVLYEDIIAPVLNSLAVPEEQINELIWQEHAMSSIVRSIVEAAYPYVLREREALGLQIARSILVFCPARETHELGARMVADFYQIAGYDVIYLGADTPEMTILQAICHLKPDYLSISVTNPYNLFEARRLIRRLREQAGYDLEVLAGGYAFAADPSTVAATGVDRLLHRFSDILELRNQEEVNAE